MHAAFLALGQLSVQRPIFPKRSQPVPLFEQPPVEVVPPSALTEHSGHSKPRPDPLALPQENAALAEFLRAHQRTFWNSPVQQQRLTVTQLAMLSFADLRLALPSLPAGILCDMQDAAKSWLQHEAGVSHVPSLPLAIAYIACTVHFAGPSCR